MAPKKAAPPSSTGKQSTLLGFFSKTPSSSNVNAHANAPPSSSPSQQPRRSNSASSAPKVVPAKNKAASPPSSSGNGSADAGPSKRAKRDEGRKLETVGEDVVEAGGGDGQGDVTVHGDATMEVDGEDDFPVVSSSRNKRRVVTVESSDEDDDDPKTRKKLAPKKKKAAASDDDDFEFEGDDAMFAAAASQFDEPFDPSDEEDEPKPKSKSKAKAPIRPSARPVPTSTPSASRKSASASAGGGGSNAFLTQAEIRKQKEKEDKKANEDCFDFLRDIKDIDGHRPDDPEYDPRTLYIPKSAWSKFTPFETQFWEIKQNHFDTVLFFQKGKFFELYENDAERGHLEFGLKLTDRVKMKMVGVPEQQFEIWAAKFLAAGYKVGRVEQAETALGAEMRQKSAKAGGKKAPAGKEIVRRELKHVLTNGTISDAAYLAGDDASQCICIKEESASSTQPAEFGVTILDAATGAFSLCSFSDDVCRTRLETVFRQLRPKELIYEKGNISTQTLRILRGVLPTSTVWTALKPDTEFLSSEATLDLLREFFPPPEEGGEDETDSIPDVIRKESEKPLVMSALGGLISYLKQLNLDKDLLSQRNFDIYDPVRPGQTLYLDGQTLAHIEVLVNNEGNDEGTLLKLLQRCATPMGKRLFRQWVCLPLRQPAAINQRLDAVEELMNHSSFQTDFKKLAKGLPDLERLVSRIHAGRCKLSEFIKVLDAFDKVKDGIEHFSSIAEGFESTSVLSLLQAAPDLTPSLTHVRSLYTYDSEEGTILPVEGADEQYEEIMSEIAGVEEQLEELRATYAEELGTTVTYWSSAQGQKDIYQIAVKPTTKVPKNWTKTGGTKAQTRYSTPESLPLIRSLQEARETRTQVVKDFLKRLFLEFDSQRSNWLRAVKTISEIDCLCSLACASNEMDEPKCRPEFVEEEGGDEGEAFIDFTDLRHPAMALTRDFIPNDVQMGGGKARTVLLTGPNMAGKSTLLRMTAAGVILAQLGMYVPARSARLSPIDSVKTRMGAYDDMFSASSTFKVELDECSKILREAGPRSLVFLDELGRGTSTFDGTSIAGAVLHHMSTHTLPLTFFATHYGSLAQEYAYHPNIRSMHMSAQVDNEKREVVFLYRLIDGIAESSYGTHVAKLAGVPDGVVTRADDVSSLFKAELDAKLAAKRRSALPLVAHADFAFLFKLGIGQEATSRGGAHSLALLRDAVGKYERNG